MRIVLCGVLVSLTGVFLDSAFPDEHRHKGEYQQANKSKKQYRLNQILECAAVHFLQRVNCKIVCSLVSVRTSSTAASLKIIRKLTRHTTRTWFFPLQNVPQKICERISIISAFLVVHSLNGVKSPNSLISNTLTNGQFKFAF